MALQEVSSTTVIGIMNEAELVWAEHQKYLIQGYLVYNVLEGGLKSIYSQ